MRDLELVDEIDHVVEPAAGFRGGLDGSAGLGQDAASALSAFTAAVCKVSMVVGDVDAYVGCDRVGRADRQKVGSNQATRLPANIANTNRSFVAMARTSLRTALLAPAFAALLAPSALHAQAIGKVGDVSFPVS